MASRLDRPNRPRASTPPRWSFTQVSHARAPIEAVWPLVGEAGRWKDWSFLTRSDLEREGDPAPDGVGAMRRFTALGVGSREEVLEWQPPRHLSYGLVSGFPVRDYRADVDLTSDADGTTLSWSVRFNPRLAGTGAVMWVVLRVLIFGFARGACRFADRQLT
ncbi:MAG TPA: SRPBCC family protein [Acidimicrobiales bacterium]|nr:SRPBCC family protein [Acidimicrobiales bacterium]